MADREPARFDALSDSHLADRAAYGDDQAFLALADRFGDLLWTTAVLASGDAAVATQATARAFTRTLAAQAAGIAEPDAPVAPALVAATYELARDRSRATDTDPIALPAALATLHPDQRVGLWLREAHGWTDEQVGDALRPAPGDEATAAPAPPTGAARAAAATLDLPAPPEVARATGTAWHEWQDIGLTIPERHPLTAAVARLDAPLGRMGDALGRIGERASSRVRTRRAERAALAPTTLVLAGLDDDAPAATLPPERTVEPIEADATPARRHAAPVVRRPAYRPQPASPVVDVTAPAAAPAALLAPPPPAAERRPLASPRLVAGATPTRTRILAAIAAGILTAGAVGSLLTAETVTPTGRGESAVEAGARADSPAAGDDLLDGPDRAVPAANVTDAPAVGSAPSAPPPASTPGGSGSRVDVRSGVSPSGPAPAAGPASSGSRSPATGGASGGTAAASSGGASGGGAAPGGGSGGGTPAAPPATTTPTPPPTTAPTPPTTTPPPPPTTTPTPPPTTPNPVCGLLPVLCP